MTLESLNTLIEPPKKLHSCDDLSDSASVSNTNLLDKYDYDMEKRIELFPRTENHPIDSMMKICVSNDL